MVLSFWHNLMILHTILMLVACHGVIILTKHAQWSYTQSSLTQPDDPTCNPHVSSALWCYYFDKKCLMILHTILMLAACCGVIFSTQPDDPTCNPHVSGMPWCYYFDKKFPIILQAILMLAAHCGVIVMTQPDDSTCNPNVSSVPWWYHFDQKCPMILHTILLLAAHHGVIVATKNAQWYYMQSYC